MTFSITGQIPSGKNQVKTVLIKGKVLHIPDARFKKWKKGVLPELELQRGTCSLFPIATPVSLECEYTPGDRRTRDVSGMLDALFHVIVKAGLLTDDGLVWAVTWRRNEMDRQRPGLRFTMTKQEAP